MAAIPQFNMSSPNLTEVQRIEGTQLDKRRVLKLKGVTADATPLEIFVDGVTNNRIGINADSVVTFNALSVARAPTAANSGGYNDVGTIGRFGATTALVGAVTQVAREGNAALALTFTADDTNDALVCTVTGIAATSIRWEVDVYLTESTDIMND